MGSTFGFPASDLHPDPLLDLDRNQGRSKNRIDEYRNPLVSRTLISPLSDPSAPAQAGPWLSRLDGDRNISHGAQLRIPFQDSLMIAF
jgi:hypothetical protein